ncbi:post-transcriptional regulator [Tepidibacillus marianensis]|uniref:post-transcriptional regulator n=1 Tax=Tepidibacillus marianensis TaxID=3131995 RepID=UPI0030D436AF
MDELDLEEYDRQLEALCESKAEEFHMMGYDHVTAKEIWQCVSDKYKKDIPSLHQVVNDILSLKVTTFMNWMTLNAYKGLYID